MRSITKLPHICPSIHNEEIFLIVFFFWGNIVLRSITKLLYIYTESVHWEIPNYHPNSSHMRWYLSKKPTQCILFSSPFPAFYTKKTSANSLNLETQTFLAFTCENIPMTKSSTDIITRHERIINCLGRALLGWIYDGLTR